MLAVEISLSAAAVKYNDCLSADGEDLPRNEYPGYDTKQSDGETPALKLCGIWRASSLPLLPGPLWPGRIAPDKGQIELFKLCENKGLILNRIFRNRTLAIWLSEQWLMSNWIVSDTQQYLELPKYVQTNE